MQYVLTGNCFIRLIWFDSAYCLVCASYRSLQELTICS